MAWSGWRRSWLAAARNFDFARFACSALEADRVPQSDELREDAVVAAHEDDGAEECGQRRRDDEATDPSGA
jgi:hypothetical protein